MTKHNWRTLKDLHQTDTFDVTYLAFIGIPILIDVTHIQYVSLCDSMSVLFQKLLSAALFWALIGKIPKRGSRWHAETVIYCPNICRLLCK